MGGGGGYYTTLTMPNLRKYRDYDPVMWSLLSQFQSILRRNAGCMQYILHKVLKM